MIATGCCGVVYALSSGQPLALLGGVAPVIVLLQAIYDLCQSLGVPFLPALSWVGLWTMLLLLTLAAFEASSWIRYFTRFTDDVFAALISLIFIYEAARALLLMFGKSDCRRSCRVDVSVLGARHTLYRNGTFAFSAQPLST